MYYGMAHFLQWSPQSTKPQNTKETREPPQEVGGKSNIINIFTMGIQYKPNNHHTYDFCGGLMPYNIDQSGRTLQKPDVNKAW